MLRQLDIDNSIKFEGKEAYDRILEYFTGNYLSSPGYRLDHGKPGIQERVEAKARRIYAITGSRDDLANWVRAESYVGRFYNNVVAARFDDAVSKSELREAVAISENPKYGCSIMDCFEAMVLVYCVRDFDLPEKIMMWGVNHSYA